MTTSKKKIYRPTILSFLFTGGLKAIQSAAIGSFGFFIFYTTSGIAIDYWRQEFVVTNIAITDLLISIPAIILGALVVVLVSMLPAFIGGILLAWSLYRDNDSGKLGTWKRFGKGNQKF